MLKRPDKAEIFLAMARLVSFRGTCLRRQVGCVLTNGLGHVLATGYNGVARGLKHCTDKPCPGVGSQSGYDLDLCQAIHAEQNALLQCRNPQEIAAAYITVAPCATCTKLLLNTNCDLVVFSDIYTPEHLAVFKDLWFNQSGRDFYQLAENPVKVTYQYHELTKPS